VPARAFRSAPQRLRMPRCSTSLDFGAPTSNRSCLGDAGKLATAQDLREVWSPRKTTRRICRLKKPGDIGGWAACILQARDHRATNTAARLRNSDATSPGSYPRYGSRCVCCQVRIIYVYIYFEAWHLESPSNLVIFSSVFLAPHTCVSNLHYKVCYVLYIEVKHTRLHSLRFRNK
jgi:hypothetical protein